MSTKDTPLSALSWIRKFHFGWTDAEVRQAEIDEAPETAPVVPEDHPTTTYSAKLLFELWHLQDYGDYRAQAAIAAQAQQAQGVPAPDLIAAAQAVVRDALDAVEVHPCDVNDDSVRAKFLLGSMAALHSALAAAPQAEPAQPQQADEALAQTLRNIATTLERQLDLIAERAPGEFLDKRPVVQSLAQHLKRARKALADYSSGHAQAEPQPSIPVHHINDLTDRVATLRDKLRRDGRTFAVETLDKVLVVLDVAHAHVNDRWAATSPEGQAFTGDSPFRAIGGKGGYKP